MFVDCNIVKHFTVMMPSDGLKVKTAAAADEVSGRTRRCSPPPSIHQYIETLSRSSKVDKTQTVVKVSEEEKDEGEGEKKRIATPF